MLTEKHADISAFACDYIRGSTTQKIKNRVELTSNTSPSKQVPRSSKRKPYVTPRETDGVDMQLASDPLQLLNLKKAAGDQKT